MAPVNVKKLTCDGNTHKCTANLVSGLLVLDGWFLRLLLTLFCRAGIWWWALGSTVGRQSLPPLERRLSQVEISQERERSTRAGDVRRIRNMRNVQYTVLFWECDSWFSIILFDDRLKLATHLYLTWRCVTSLPDSLSKDIKTWFSVGFYKSH